jgi:hypothetical protein
MYNKKMTQNLFLLMALLFIQAITIFFLSRKNFNNFFHFFRKFFHNENTVYALVSLVFLPGTIIHELSHFFAAIVLFLPVKDIQIFPKFEDGQIKLGHVLYVKKDFLRGILVGVAPFFGALFLFFGLSFFNLFPNENLGLNIFLIYLIFTVSSVMFSSKQDLVDIIYVIPLIIFLLIIGYIFQPLIPSFKLPYLKNIIAGLEFFLTNVNYYLFLSILIHLFLITIFSFVNKKK